MREFECDDGPREGGVDNIDEAGCPSEVERWGGSTASGAIIVAGVATEVDRGEGAKLALLDDEMELNMDGACKDGDRIWAAGAAIGGANVEDVWR